MTASKVGILSPECQILAEIRALAAGFVSMPLRLTELLPPSHFGLSVTGSFELIAAAPSQGILGMPVFQPGIRLVLHIAEVIVRATPR